MAGATDTGQEIEHHLAKGPQRNAAADHLTSQLSDERTAARERFLRRREIAEKTLLKGQRVNRVITSDGAAVKVIEATAVFPDDVKSPQRDPKDQLRLTVYLPGMSKIDPANQGSAEEIHLAGALIDSRTDALMMLKPEGVEARAYSNPRSPQYDTSEAAASSVRKQIAVLQENSPGKRVEIKIIGLSEGASIAPSLAARLLESGGDSLTIESLVSVCGAGLAGPEKPSLAATLQTITRAALTANEAQADYDKLINEAVAKGDPLSKYSFRSQTPGMAELFVDAAVVGIPRAPDGAGERKPPPDPGGLEAAIGPRATAPDLNYKNFSRVIMEMFPGLSKPGEAVPRQRLSAAFAHNPDWEIVAQNNIPTTVIASTRDGLFPFPETMGALQKLKAENPGWSAEAVATNLKHAAYHDRAAGVGALINIVENDGGSPDQSSE